jgi:hypothetical protein
MSLLILRILLHQHHLLFAATVLARLWWLLNVELVHAHVVVLRLTSVLLWLLIILLLRILLIVILRAR